MDGKQCYAINMVGFVTGKGIFEIVDKKVSYHPTITL